MQRKRLEEVLIEYSFVRPKDLNLAKMIAVMEGKSLDEVLVREGLLKPDTLVTVKMYVHGALLKTHDIGTTIKLSPYGEVGSALESYFDAYLRIAVDPKNNFDRKNLENSIEYRTNPLFYDKN